MNLGLQGKVVMITGASGGIGSELVRQFLAEGAKVIIHYHRNKKSAEGLAKNLSQEQYELVQANLTNELDVKKMWVQATDKLGPVDILVANAGVCLGYGKPIQEVTLEQWNNTLAGNLTSVFLCIREFFKGIKEFGLKEPSVILMGSTAGQYGEAYNADYSASKAPLNAGFLLSLKNELARLAPRGRVNAICPSWTVSEMVEELLAKPEHVTKVLQTVALRKVGRPAEVAQIALFLASSIAAGHCTGQVITAAGGMEGRLLYQPQEIDLKNI